MRKIARCCTAEGAFHFAVVRSGIRKNSGRDPLGFLANSATSLGDALQLSYTSPMRW
jgi:hypothetical protein